MPRESMVAIDLTGRLDPAPMAHECGTDCRRMPQGTAPFCDSQALAVRPGATTARLCNILRCRQLTSMGTADEPGIGRASRAAMWVHSTRSGNEFAGTAQDAGNGVRSEKDRGSGLEEKWSLTAHSPGQEPWILSLEQSVLLSRAAGDDDGLAGELAIVAD